MMRAFARSHQRPDPENKTCRLCKAARETHFRLTAKGVNMPPAAFKYRIFSDSGGRDRHTVRRQQLHQRTTRDGTCGRETRTLAPESRHIVSFLLSGTTSRAAVNTVQVALVWRRRSIAVNATGEGQGI